MTTRLPFGSWPSPLPPSALVAGAVRVLEPSLDGEDVYWLEGRPSNGGRQTLVRRRSDGTAEDLTPPELNVRDRVHEYGGGSYVVDGDVAWLSSFADGRLHRRDRDGTIVPITPEGRFRYADLVVDRSRDRIVCIREDHTDDRPSVVRNELVAVPASGGDPVVLAGGRDFYANPRLSPDGRRLAWLEWDHPNLPWDETALLVADLDGAGRPSNVTRVAGEPGESILQPRWSPDGVLHVVAERSGWWNLYRWVDGRLEPVAPMEAELAHPQWVFRMSSWAFAGDGSIVATARSGGREHLIGIQPAAERGAEAGPGTVVDLGLPFTEVEYVEAAGERAVFVGGSPTRPPAIVELDLRAGTWRALTEPSSPLDPDLVSVGRPIEFPTTGDRTAFGIFYAPHLPGYAGLDGELPPLVVTSHGGPTSSASTTLSTLVQLLTTRGIAVLDVDYGGSTGYGREYRKRLERMWGITDVDDCVAGAAWLAHEGLVDPKRTAIRGGSSSGYTTLCALAFRDAFDAGVSHFGIGDLESFRSETHKFESQYDHSLIGPYPELRDVYRERSPLNAADRISVPVLITQGLDDHIVPPEQAEEIVAVLRERRIPHAYLPFEGEDHGYRRAETIVRSFEAELSFFAQVFGFEPADPIDRLPIAHFEG